MPLALPRRVHVTCRSKQSDFTVQGAPAAPRMSENFSRKKLNQERNVWSRIGRGPEARLFCLLDSEVGRFKRWTFNECPATPVAKVETRNKIGSDAMLAPTGWGLPS
ncbi:hypothetical protein KM043_003817 [Ampulex compressa]|nr:hypothetical protein KM043_003817 [Ampulex compressa]